MTDEERKIFALQEAVKLHAHREFRGLVGVPSDAVLEAAGKFEKYLTPEI